MSQLILFTNGYPYGNGETFLENEIPYLSYSFDNILIIASSNEDIFNSPNRIPGNIDNVSVIKCYTKHRPFLYRFLGLRYLGSYVKIQNPKLMLSSLLIVGRLKYIYKKIKKPVGFFANANTIAYSYWLTLAPLAIWTRKNNHNIIKTISRAHRYDLYTDMHPWNFEPVKRQCLKKLDSIYSCSEDGKAYLKKNYSDIVSNCKIEASFLGTNNYGITISSLKDRDISFVTCSTDAPVKNIPFFAKAFSSLISNNSHVMWRCIGFNPNEEIKKILGEKIIKEHCTFLGKLKNKDVINYYKQNDITFFVNVSKSEGIPVSIMEAQSFGIPVIASNVGGTGEIVNNDNGLIFDANMSVDDFVKLLIKAINFSEEEYQRKRYLSRKTWEEKSSAEINYPLFIENIKN